MLSVQLELEDWQALMDMLMQAPLPFVVTSELITKIDPQLEEQHSNYMQDRKEPPPGYMPDGGNGATRDMATRP